MGGGLREVDEEALSLAQPSGCQAAVTAGEEQQRGDERRPRGVRQSIVLHEGPVGALARVDPLGRVTRPEGGLRQQVEVLG